MSIPGGPAPLDEDVVLSAEWLTAILGARYPGVVVRSTLVTERLETVATKVRFNVEYDAPAEGAPPALCAKGYFNPAMRDRLAGSHTETTFYRELAERLPVRTPPCVHAAVDDDTGHGLVVMADLVEAGCTFLDPLASYGPDQAAATLEQLALLHASNWGKGDAPSLQAFEPRLEGLVSHFPTDALQEQLDDGRADGVTTDVRQADRVQAAMRALAAFGRSKPSCLVHGDVHTGNVYELADGSPGIIDWQVAQRGSWALDVAYHLGAVLDPDVRQRSERQLVAHYLDRLAAEGVTPPPWDDAWWAYRAHMPYGFFMWAITRAVARPIVERHTSRLGQAVAWHGSLDLLDV